MYVVHLRTRTNVHAHLLPKKYEGFLPSDYLKRAGEETVERNN
jgi:hypothetical protein